MRKTISFILTLAMAFALYACGEDKSAENTKPTAPIDNVTEETPAPEQSEASGEAPKTEGFQPLCIKNEGSLSADLDGDGKNDTVQILEWTVDEFGSKQYGFNVEGSSGLTVVWDEMLIESKPVLWLADINGDARAEILFSGDAASDDYYTNCFGWDGGSLTRILFSDTADGTAEGCVESINDGVMTIGAYCYILGTYGGLRDFVCTAEGEIAPVENSMWSFEKNEQWLTTIKELPVTLACAESTLPVGAELCLTGFNGTDTLFFVTRDNTEGTIRIEKNDSFWGWLIAGAEETEYFEALPYAG